MLYPSNLCELKEHIQRLEFKPNTDDRFNIQFTCRGFIGIVGNKNLKRKDFSESESTLLNKYSLYLSSNQINEACNRIWVAAELLNVTSPKIWRQYPIMIKNLADIINISRASDTPEILPSDLSSYVTNSYPKPLGEDFSPTYISATTVPALYFSQIALVLSILSSYGCILIRDHRDSNVMKSDNCEPRNRDYVLLRKKNGWELHNRREIISHLPIKSNTRGWHTEIMKLFQGLKKLGNEFPEIELSCVEELRDLRIKTHYEVMGEVTVGSVMENSTTLKYIPKCISNIEIGINHLKKIWKINNGCDFRLLNLKKRIPDLFDSYK